MPDESAQGPPRTARRELGIVCAGLVIAAVVMLGALTRTWVVVSAQRAAPLSAVTIHATGRTVSPLLGGLAIVILAGALAMLATSGRARQALGGLLAVLGGCALIAALRLVDGPTLSRSRDLIADRASGIGLDAGFAVTVDSSPVWPLVAALGALLAMLCGVAAVVRGGRWKAMSRRYDAPSQSADRVELPAGADAQDVRKAEDLALWTALDRGDDPTRR